MMCIFHWIIANQEDAILISFHRNNNIWLTFNIHQLTGSRPLNCQISNLVWGLIFVSIVCTGTFSNENTYLFNQKIYLLVFTLHLPLKYWGKYKKIAIIIYLSYIFAVWQVFCNLCIHLCIHTVIISYPWWRFIL